MADEACLYTVLWAEQERHDALLLDWIAPLVRQIDEAPELDSFFFVRFNEPRWQLRLRILGRPAWIDGPVRDRVARLVGELDARGLIDGAEYGEYQRELERYGGPLGMRLAERLFRHDSAACLDLLAIEAAGGLAKSRREWSLVHTERLLDLLSFDYARRLAFYERGQRWAFDEGVWTEADRERLAQRYAALGPGLEDLLVGDQRGDPERQFGGAAPARISRRCRERQQPVIEELLAAHARGEVAQDIVDLAWSYAHLHCNRLGIDVLPEAILRFFMHRFYTEHPPV